MGALKLRKDVSKPGLLRVVRGVFEVVVEGRYAGGSFPPATV